MTRNANIWYRIDKISILIFLLMLIMGWLNIYAAVYNEDHKEILDFSQRYGKQFVWIIATIVIAVFVSVVDTRFYFFFANFIYGGLMLLLVLVLFLGRNINGARSWFDLGNFNLQPSEFAKFGTVLALASYLNLRRQDLRKFRVFIASSAIIVFPAFLIALEPDLGTSAVFFALFLVLFREGMSPYIFVSGIIMVVLFFLTLIMNNLYLCAGLVVLAFILSWFTARKPKIILTGIAVFAVTTLIVYLINYYVTELLSDDMVLFVSVIISGICFAYYFYSKRARSLIVIFFFLLGSLVFVNSVDFVFSNLLKPHQKERVEITLGLRSDPHGTGYNVNQSIISIGSGGFIGKGYLKGTQTKFKFVPSQSTDFIFCTVGEEWGFVGSIVVIGLYVILLLRLIKLAERQRSDFSRIYGYGVVCILFVHFFINIGMAVGILPVIGIPLPFFSYGGSALWGFTILLFVFLRLDASRTEYLT